MGYEIWDIISCALVADFDDQEQALGFLRRIVEPMSAEEATRWLKPLQLVRVTNEGRTTEIVREGVTLLDLIFAPAPTR
jgi:hypothetical protein